MRWGYLPVTRVTGLRRDRVRLGRTRGAEPSVAVTPRMLGAAPGATALHRRHPRRHHLLASGRTAAHCCGEYRLPAPHRAGNESGLHVLGWHCFHSMVQAPANCCVWRMLRYIAPTTTAAIEWRFTAASKAVVSTRKDKTTKPCFRIYHTENSARHPLPTQIPLRSQPQLWPSIQGERDNWRTICARLAM